MLVLDSDLDLDSSTDSEPTEWELKSDSSGSDDDGGGDGGLSKGASTQPSITNSKWGSLQGIMVTTK